MSRQLSAAERRELAYLRNRSLMIVNFVAEHTDEPFSSAPQLRQVIEHTFQAGNLRGMRIIRSDLLDLSRALRAEDQRALAELLKAQAVDDPFSIDAI